MKMDEPRVMFFDIPVSKTRCISPMTPSPYRERNNGFLDIISRRFNRRSHDELCFQHHGENDSRSSSTDSCSSTSGHLAVTTKTGHNSNLELACSTSDSSSNDSNDNPTIHSDTHRRSSSSIRRALQNLSFSSRSLSCSSTPNKEQKPKKTKKIVPTKRILRQPISYTYLKGMSGLPTQRVPRSSVCCQTHR